MMAKLTSQVTVCRFRRRSLAETVKPLISASVTPRALATVPLRASDCAFVGAASAERDTVMATLTVSTVVGPNEGVNVGCVVTVGIRVGAFVSDGRGVGAVVGTGDGTGVGTGEGANVGTGVGTGEGARVCTTVETVWFKMSTLILKASSRAISHETFRTAVLIT